MTSIRTWLLLLIVFISGFAIGGAGTVIYVHRVVTQQHDGQPPGFFLKRGLERRLQLTEQQRSVFNREFEAFEKDLADTREQKFAEFRSRLREHLSPAQQEEFESFREGAGRRFGRHRFGGNRRN